APANSPAWRAPAMRYSEMEIRPAGANEGQEGASQPAGTGDEPLPAAARVEPGRLVSLGRGSFRPGASKRQAGAPFDRLLGLPLVPRDGPRVFRRRDDGGADESPVRQHQGRSRRAPGYRPYIPDGAPVADTAPGWLAAHDVHRPGRAKAVF